MKVPAPTTQGHKPVPTYTPNRCLKAAPSPAMTVKKRCASHLKHQSPGKGSNFTLLSHIAQQPTTRPIMKDDQRYRNLLERCRRWPINHRPLIQDLDSEIQLFYQKHIDQYNLTSVPRLATLESGTFQTNEIVIIPIGIFRNGTIPRNKRWTPYRPTLAAKGIG